MSIDDRALEQLTEESQDLHADAQRASAGPLAELTERGLERRAAGEDDVEANRAFAAERSRVARSRGFFSKGALAGVGFGAALLALMESPAYADQTADVQILQTAASIENLAVATYTLALTLPFIGGDSANVTIKNFAITTARQHEQHGIAFNALVTKLGGKAQTAPDPVLQGLVNQAKPGLTSPLPVVNLAILLEQAAEETYVANITALADENARVVTASIMGVEAQHAATLLAVRELLVGLQADLIVLPPPDLMALPPALGSVGFPEAFVTTQDARPSTEGVVK
ncbi:MAG: hypothetical protein JWL73_1627 [Actinomycetia bacterium]|nr:hypothetical protein [Actinomycetes bacterium]